VTEKITNYQNLALEIKNICKVNNVSIHPFVISVERVVMKNFLKYLDNIGLTKNVIRVEQKQVTLRTYHTNSNSKGMPLDVRGQFWIH
jgi:hypothetical protein